MIRRLAVVASLVATLLTAAGTTSDAGVVADSKVNATGQLLRNDAGL
jgi:hypothetical protein